MRPIWFLLFFILSAGCGGGTASPTSPPRVSAERPPSPPSPRAAEPEAERSREEVEGLIIRLFLEDPEERAAAARALGEHGARARPAVPHLGDCVRSDEPGPASACARALARIGEPSLYWLDYLVSVAGEVRLRAIAALSEMGDAGAELLARAYLDACAELERGDLDTEHRALTERARARAGAALRAIPEAAGPALAGFSDSPARRRCARVALG